jgi:site-specific recombinase XerD
LSSTQRYTHVTSRQLIDMCVALHPLTMQKKDKND